MNIPAGSRDYADSRAAVSQRDCTGISKTAGIAPELIGDLFLSGNRHQTIQYLRMSHKESSIRVKAGLPPIATGAVLLLYPGNIHRPVVSRTRAILGFTLCAAALAPLEPTSPTVNTTVKEKG